MGRQSTISCCSVRDGAASSLATREGSLVSFGKTSDEVCRRCPDAVWTQRDSTSLGPSHRSFPRLPCLHVRVSHVTPASVICESDSRHVNFTAVMGEPFLTDTQSTSKIISSLQLNMSEAPSDSSRPHNASTQLEEDDIFVALTHDTLDAVTIMNKVRSPKAGAIVLFAGTP